MLLYLMLNEQSPSVENPVHCCCNHCAIHPAHNNYVVMSFQIKKKACRILILLQKCKNRGYFWLLKLAKKWSVMKQGLSFWGFLAFCQLSKTSLKELNLYFVVSMRILMNLLYSNKLSKIPKFWAATHSTSLAQSGIRTGHFLEPAQMIPHLVFSVISRASNLTNGFLENISSKTFVNKPTNNDHSRFPTITTSFSTKSHRKL